VGKLVELQNMRGHKATSAKELIEAADKANRPMDAGETAIFDRLETEIATIDAQITAEQEHAARAARLAAIQDRIERPAGRITTPDQPGIVQAATPKLPATYYTRVRPMKAFTGPNANERAYRAGMWCLANLYGNEKAANYCLTHGVGGSIRAAMGENSNAAGGFLVPEEFSDTVIVLREQYGIFRQNCYVQPMSRDTMVVPRRLTGVTIAAVGENPASAISQSNPTWNQVRLTAKKCGGLSLYSSEVAEDAVIDLADTLAGEFAYAFAKFEDDCGFIGDGTSAYLGIRGLGNLFTTTGGVGGAQLVGAVDAASGHDTFAEIDATDLATVIAKLPQYALPGAKWFVSSVGMAMVFGRLMAAAGGNTIPTIEAGYRPMYLGYPIVIAQSLPTSTGDLSDLPMLYFGDLSKAATLGDRRDVRVFPSEHRYMDTDQIGVRGTCRIDIVVHDVGDTTTGNAGPIVALVGE